MRTGIRLLIVFIIMFGLDFSRFGRDVVSSPGERMELILSHDAEEYQEALKGFFEVLRENRVDVETVRLNLQDFGGDIDRVIEKVRADCPDIIITMGSPATQVVSSQISDIPIVFSMVLYPRASGFGDNMSSTGRNLTGAAMDVSIETQFRAIMGIMPRAKSIGVLYNPEESGAIVKEAGGIAAKMGLRLVSEKIYSEKDVAEALDRLHEEKVDILWSVADGTVFTIPSFRFIIRKTVQWGMPFMGPNKQFVKSGALIGIGCDYRDNGRQAAEMALRILQGKSAAEIPIAPARMIETALNLRVAEYIDLKIPGHIVNEADKVFR